MIYTLTLNPSVDYILQLDNKLKLGGLNRTKSEIKFPGGKGINVSRVLQRFGMESTALGFVGGFTGNYIEQFLHYEQIITQFIKVREDTRINIKLKAREETEINAQGPVIHEDEVGQLKEIIRTFSSEDILILSGSIPPSLPGTIYEELVKICVENRTAFVVDVEGNLLKDVLPYKPFLIKPNHHEIGAFFHKRLNTYEEIIPYAKKLMEMGAQNVMVSIADKGAVFVNKELVFVAAAPEGAVNSSVGAGDSMVAGFLAKYWQTQDMKTSFQFSVACGSATAFSLDLCTLDQVEELVERVNIKGKIE